MLPWPFSLPFCPCERPRFNPAFLFLVSSVAPITFQLPSTFGNLHDDHILYPIVKVLYALHTLLERIAASKTLEGREEERGRGRERETWRDMERGLENRVLVE